MFCIILLFTKSRLVTTTTISGFAGHPILDQFPSPSTLQSPSFDQQTTPLALQGPSLDQRPSPFTLPPLELIDMPPLVLRHFLGEALDWTGPPCQATEFQFEWSSTAATHNWSILEQYGLNFQQALEAQPISAVTPGSEFRPVSKLAHFLSEHPLWPNCSRWLTTGVEFPLAPLSEEDRMQDLEATLARGNHKTADKWKAEIEQALKKEVQRGWQLPLPKAAAQLLPGAIIAPVGMAEQETIDDQGNIVDKLRLLHDQSYNPICGTKRSVNDRVNQSALTPCMFGRALMRYIHFIVALRLAFPNEKILQTKIDCKSAYCRLHHHWSAALQACIVFGSLLLMSLRLTFGGAPNPSRWSDVSELICDLANDLVRHPGYDPQTDVSPHQDKLPVDPILEDDTVAFASAIPLAVNVPMDSKPKFDCYIDDIFGAMLLRDLKLGAGIVPFVLHLFGRPRNPTDALPRDDLLSLEKFLAETTPSELKIILGWLLDTRRLLISLPKQKFVG